jgi:hypothetical protein
MALIEFSPTETPLTGMVPTVLIALEPHIKTALTPIFIEILLTVPTPLSPSPLLVTPPHKLALVVNQATLNLHKTHNLITLNIPQTCNQITPRVINQAKEVSQVKVDKVLAKMVKNLTKVVKNQAKVVKNQAKVVKNQAKVVNNQAKEVAKEALAKAETMEKTLFHLFQLMNSSKISTPST